MIFIKEKGKGLLVCFGIAAAALLLGQWIPIIARDKTLEEIFRELARWYDFETVYTRPALKQVRFHLHTNRYATIRDILDHLQSTNGIHFSYIDNKIYVSQ